MKKESKQKPIGTRFGIEGMIITPPKKEEPEKEKEEKEK